MSTKLIPELWNNQVPNSVFIILMDERLNFIAQYRSLTCNFPAEFGLIGGGVSIGEDPMGAIVREFGEETSIPLSSILTSPINKLCFIGTSSGGIGIYSLFCADLGGVVGSIVDSPESVLHKVFGMFDAIGAEGALLRSVRGVITHALVDIVEPENKLSADFFIVDKHKIVERVTSQVKAIRRLTLLIDRDDVSMASEIVNDLSVHGLDEEKQSDWRVASVSSAYQPPSALQYKVIHFDLNTHYVYYPAKIRSTQISALKSTLRSRFPKSIDILATSKKSCAYVSSKNLKITIHGLICLNSKRGGFVYAELFAKGNDSVIKETVKKLTQSFAKTNKSSVKKILIINPDKKLTRVLEASGWFEFNYSGMLRENATGNTTTARIYAHKQSGKKEVK